jgi:hypothetical protein
MQVQDIHNLASYCGPAVKRPVTSATASPWTYLPIHWLEHCQKVDRQFANLQVEFESAIAVQPSNPRFQVGHLPIAIMSPDQGKLLNVTVGKTIKAVEMWLMGSRSVTVSALDKTGHCVAIARTQDLDDETIPRLSAQRITLETQAADAIRLDSKSPFVLTRFAIQKG